MKSSFLNGISHRYASTFWWDSRAIYSWNPAVHTDCSGLQASEYVCVGVAGAAATTTTGSIEKERSRLAEYGTANCQVKTRVKQ